MKIIAQNKKAYFDYEILEKLEAGIALRGDEVKSIRKGHVNLTGSYVVPHDRQLFMINAHIAAYSHAYQKPSDDETRRRRPLLLHRRQINKLIGEVSRDGVTLIPLKLYINNKGYVKVEIGVCKHKKAHVRKEELREKDIQRETRRDLRGKFDY